MVARKLGIATALGVSMMAFSACGAQSNQGVTQEVIGNQLEEIGTMEKLEDSTELQTEEILSETYLVEQVEDGYCRGERSDIAKEASFSLKELEVATNSIVDLESWLEENSLQQPIFPYSDDKYEYQLVDDNAYYAVQLELTNRETKEIFIVNLSDYEFGKEIKSGDEEFIHQSITWAKVDNDVLYVSIGHHTYAESSPQTAYIIAIDIKEPQVIWKSMPLTNNSYSFEVVDGSIICGYGFTDEDDYLYVLDKKTGECQESIPIKSKPDYIIRANDLIYVRTYNTNYKFQINQNK